MPESEPRDDTYAIPPIEPLGRLSVETDGDERRVIAHRLGADVVLDTRIQGIRESLDELDGDDFAQVLMDIADYLPERVSRWSVRRTVTVPDRHATPLPAGRFPTKTYRLSLRTGDARRQRIVRDIRLVDQDSGHPEPVSPVE